MQRLSKDAVMTKDEIKMIIAVVVVLAGFFVVAANLPDMIADFINSVKAGVH